MMQKWGNYTVAALEPIQKKKITVIAGISQSNYIQTNKSRSVSHLCRGRDKQGFIKYLPLSPERSRVLSVKEKIIICYKSRI